MDEAAENRRVYWHSRRGMLELDLVLMPFAEQVYPGLDADMQRRYRALLACEDADLFAWIVHRGEPDDPELKTIIARVLGNGMPRPELPPGAV
jgi:antitoxin CptB